VNSSLPPKTCRCRCQDKDAGLDGLREKNEVGWSLRRVLIWSLDGDLEATTGTRIDSGNKEVGRMVEKTDMARLRGERWRLERMLEKLPEERVIDRLGLEERLAQVAKALAGSEPQLRAVPQRRLNTEQGGST